MADVKCTTCGGPLETGFVTTTNGSGLFWAHESTESRLRPKGLEVLVPTGFMGTYSANAAAQRCRACGTITLKIGK
ncbi:MAG TPA: PF20097 family protein [Thermoplasmata archaeon]|nr:PF20097 family protein [Thermoplasmata archaeon]